MAVVHAGVTARARGMKLRFILKPPHGPEHSNNHQKALLTPETADRPAGEIAQFS
jgi:hypothetical protein